VSEIIPVKVNETTHPIKFAQVSSNVVLPPVKVAKELRVVRQGTSAARLYINGELFPFATVDGFKVGPTGRAVPPTVSLTLIADRVELIDDMYPDDAP